VGLERLGIMARLVKLIPPKRVLDLKKMLDGSAKDMRNTSLSVCKRVRIESITPSPLPVELEEFKFNNAILISSAMIGARLEMLLCGSRLVGFMMKGKIDH